tara:strand:- start:2722 stop:4221 length:1500 start_codon:yes stop_codon:yes gene_type:complete
MNKKIFYHPQAVQSPNFITIIDEILEEIALNKSNLYLIKCEGQIKFCQSNLKGNANACKLCVNTFNIIEKSLNLNEKINIITLKSNKGVDEKITTFIKENINDINSFNDLKKLHYNKINLGYGIVSTYVSITRNNTWNLIDKELLIRIIKGALYSLLTFELTTSDLNVDEVYLYNGRFHDNKPILNLFKSKKFTILETIGARVNTRFKKYIFSNSTPHSITDYTNNILKNWETSNLNDEEKVNIGAQFFEKRARSISAGDVSYTSGQNITEFKFLEKKKQQIVIYNSSPDELFSIGEEWDWVFEELYDQASVIHLLCSELKDMDFQIILRCHPNLITYKGDEIDRYKDLDSKFDNFTFIAPDSKISTYGLLFKADYVVSFGSTIGIEASYWNKTSILIGSSFYQNLDVVHRVQNLKEFLAVLNSQQNENFNKKIEILKYGFFMMEKTYNVKSFFRLIPTNFQLDNKFMYYSLIKNFSLYKRLLIMFNVLLNRILVRYEK